MRRIIFLSIAVIVMVTASAFAWDYRGDDKSDIEVRHDKVIRALEFSRHIAAPQVRPAVKLVQTIPPDDIATFPADHGIIRIIHSIMPWDMYKVNISGINYYIVDRTVDADGNAVLIMTKSPHSTLNPDELYGVVLSKNRVVLRKPELLADSRYFKKYGASYIAKTILGFGYGLCGESFSIIDITRTDTGGWEVIVARRPVTPDYVSYLYKVELSSDFTVQTKSNCLARGYDEKKTYAIYLAKEALGYNIAISGVTYKAVDVTMTDSGGWIITMSKTDASPEAVSKIYKVMVLSDFTVVTKFNKKHKDPLKAYAARVAKEALGYNPFQCDAIYSIVNMARTESGGWEVIVSKTPATPNAESQLYKVVLANDFSVLSKSDRFAAGKDPKAEYAAYLAKIDITRYRQDMTVDDYVVTNIKRNDNCEWEVSMVKKGSEPNRGQEYYVTTVASDFKIIHRTMNRRFPLMLDIDIYLTEIDQKNSVERSVITQLADTRFVNEMTGNNVDTSAVQASLQK